MQKITYFSNITLLLSWTQCLNKVNGCKKKQHNDNISDLNVYLCTEIVSFARRTK